MHQTATALQTASQTVTLIVTVPVTAFPTVTFTVIAPVTAFLTVTFIATVHQTAIAIATVIASTTATVSQCAATGPIAIVLVTAKTSVCVPLSNVTIAIRIGWIAIANAVQFFTTVQLTAIVLMAPTVHQTATVHPIATAYQIAGRTATPTATAYQIVGRTAIPIATVYQIAGRTVTPIATATPIAMTLQIAIVYLTAYPTATVLPTAIATQTAIATVLPSNSFSRKTMITITSVKQDGQLVERLYENRTQAFYSMTGDMIAPPKWKQPKSESACSSEHPLATNGGAPNRQMSNGKRPKQERDVRKSEKYFNKITDDEKSPDVKLLKIQLGLSCNYSCSYCKQSIYVTEAETSSSKDLDDFIANFDTWCTAPREDKITVQLWGGEPLIYFKKIQKLVAFLRGRFDHAQISTLSNGSLLSQEIVDYLIENDIRLAISHDGPGQKTTRKEDPLEEGSESLKWIKDYIERSKPSLYVNMVLSKQNHDIVAGVNYIKSILGDKVHVGYEGIVQVEDEGQFDQSSFFSDEDYAELRASFREAISSGAAKHISPFNRKMQDLLRAWYSGGKNQIFNNSFQKCGMDDKFTLAVNLKGDALVCHSTSNKIGSVYAFDDIKMSSGGAEHWATKAECLGCPVLSLCKGSCMNQHGNAWYYTCNNEFHFNMSVFEAAFEQVFKERIVNLSGDFVRPVKSRVIPIVSGRPGMTPCAT